MDSPGAGAAVSPIVGSPIPHLNLELGTAVEEEDEDEVDEEEEEDEDDLEVDEFGGSTPRRIAPAGLRSPLIRDNSLGLMALEEEEEEED